MSPQERHRTLNAVFSCWVVVVNELVVYVEAVFHHIGEHVGADGGRVMVDDLQLLVTMRPDALSHLVIDCT